MRHCYLLIILCLGFNLTLVRGQKDTSSTALLLIDIQNFYFSPSEGALVHPEAAAHKARLALDRFREKGMLVVHIKHQAKQGADIYQEVMPSPSEKVIVKDHVNSFYKPDLLDYLKVHHIKKLVICGMMTHMCLEAATRAGHDLGFSCTVLSDACATRDLKFGEKIIPAEAVHLSTLATLTYYARIIDVETFLHDLK